MVALVAFSWPMGNTGTPFLGPGLWLAGSLLVGALLVALFRRWQRQETRVSASDELAHFRRLYERGQLSEEEFKRLRAVLSDELRRSLNLPDKANTPPATPDVPPEKTDPPETGIKPG